MRRTQVNPGRLLELRGKRSREVIAHELRSRGHATDAKAIWRWENGRNQPSASVLPDYAEVLGVADVRDLYGDNGNGSADDEEESSQAMTLDEFLKLRVTQIVREAVSSL